MNIPGFQRFVGMRASDADREDVVAELKRHFAAGRLTKDELAERVEAAYAAVTLAELEKLTRDLPYSPPPPEPASPTGTPRLALKATAVLLPCAVLGVMLLNTIPAELWALVLMVVVPMGAMLLFMLLPFALPLVAGLWVFRRLERGSRKDRRELPLGRSGWYEQEPAVVWQVFGTARRGRRFWR